MSVGGEGKSAWRHLTLRWLYVHVQLGRSTEIILETQTPILLPTCSSAGAGFAQSAGLSTPDFASGGRGRGRGRGASLAVLRSNTKRNMRSW